MAEESALTFDPVEVGDFDEAEEKANRVLVPAQYNTKIVKATHGQGDKAQYLRWQLETLDCEDPEDNGFMLWHSTPIEGRGIGILIDFCNALGVKWPEGQVTPEWVEEQYGSELTVETGIGNFEGRDRSEVKKCVPAIDTV